MKRILFAIMFVLSLLALTACTNPTSDEVQQSQQEQLLQQSNQQTGMPDVHNFFERKMMKSILEKRDKPDLTTYVYTESLDGHYIYIGRAIGYGLPYSTQYTNPQKIERQSQGGYAILPQADPNGLFSPASSEATWILYVDETTNESKIMYMEPRTVIRETKLPRRLCAEWSLPSNY